MKTMKQIMSLALALLLVMSISACGQKDTGTSNAAFQAGTVEGQVYTNNFVGFGCKLDENWAYYTDAELAEITGEVAQNIEEVQKALESGRSVYDMFAYTNEGLVTINVVYENMGVLYGKAMDEKSYLEASMPNIEEALTSKMGLSNVKTEQTQLQFAGAMREAATIYGELNGTPMYETLVCLKQGNYMCCITMCSWTEDITADLAALFYQV